MKDSDDARAAMIFPARRAGRLVIAILAVALAGAFALRAQAPVTKISPAPPRTGANPRIANRRRNRAGDGGVRRQRNRGSRPASRQPHSNYHGHSGRPFDLHGGHHPPHPGLARASGYFHFACRFARGFRWIFYLDVRGHRGHGSGNAHRRGVAVCWRSAAFHCKWMKR